MLRKRTQKGTAMVEGAMVMLTALSMGIFIIDMGRFMLMEQYISERARATVRQAAVNNWTETQVKNYLVYNSALPESMTAPGRLGLLPSQVAFSKLGTPGNPDYRLQVKVSGVQAFLFIPRLSGSYALPPVVATTPAEALGATQ